MLDLTIRWAESDACLTLDTVHRFSDPEYADLSLAMRTGTEPGEVFDRLVQRGQVVVHDSEQQRTDALADNAAGTGALVVADTRERVADLNAAIRTRGVAAGRVDDAHRMITQGGDMIGAGDRVITRRNDYTLDIANRDTWTVNSLDRDGRLHLVGDRGQRTLPAGYVDAHVELAYASTVYGAQGETANSAHLVLGEHTGAAAAYVAMTRGREDNVAHLVAEDLDQARRQWIDTFSRDRADLGPAHAADLAAEEAAKYATPTRPDPTRPGRPRTPPAARGSHS